MPSFTLALDPSCTSLGATLLNSLINSIVCLMTGSVSCACSQLSTAFDTACQQSIYILDIVMMEIILQYRLPLQRNIILSIFRDCLLDLARPTVPSLSRLWNRYAQVAYPERAFPFPRWKLRGIHLELLQHLARVHRVSAVFLTSDMRPSQMTSRVCCLSA